MIKYLVIFCALFLISCSDKNNLEQATYIGNRIHYSYQPSHVLLEDEFYGLVDLANEYGASAINCLDSQSIDYSLEPLTALPGIGISTWYGDEFDSLSCVKTYSNDRIEDLLINPYCSLGEINQEIDSHVFDWLGVSFNNQQGEDLAIASCL